MFTPALGIDSVRGTWRTELVLTTWAQYTERLRILRWLNATAIR
jgi:hypothetical protein